MFQMDRWLHERFVESTLTVHLDIRNKETRYRDPTCPMGGLTLLDGYAWSARTRNPPDNPHTRHT